MLSPLLLTYSTGRITANTINHKCPQPSCGLVYCLFSDTEYTISNTATCKLYDRNCGLLLIDNLINEYATIVCLQIIICCIQFQRRKLNYLLYIFESQPESTRSKEVLKSDII